MCEEWKWRSEKKSDGRGGESCEEMKAWVTLNTVEVHVLLFSNIDEYN